MMARQIRGRVLSFAIDRFVRRFQDCRAGARRFWISVAAGADKSAGAARKSARATNAPSPWGKFG